MVEGHVPQGVEVQVLSSAQDDSEKIPCLGIFLIDALVWDPIPFIE